MKKLFKIVFISVFIFAIFGIYSACQANTITEISMDIYVDSNGNAKITEIWNCNTNEGTEVYHPYYNLGNSKIQNLTVSENGTEYTSMKSWNTSGTLSSKAYKCGINNITNGVELCWGISKYGKHTYIVNYEITNFIAELTDSQMIYWTLIPNNFSDSIGNVYIKIHTDFAISDTTEVWGYGNYGGTAYVYDGYIEMQSEGKLNKNEYMTILVKFPSNTFSTANSLNHNFNYYYNMSQSGATKYKENTGNVFKTNNMLLTLVIPGFIIFVFILLIVRIYIRLCTYLNSSDVKTSKKLKKAPYFRDIPCNKDIFRIYYIAYKYGLIKRKTDILGAIILKWLKDSVIRIEQRKNDGIVKKEDTVIILSETDPNLIENERERRLFEMLLDASEDGILENKEFENWCSLCYHKILNWFDDIIKTEKKKLLEEGLIIVEEKRTLKIFKKKVETATSELTKQAEEIAGLKRYLNEYTLIKEREPLEVLLFEDYLIFAQIMGIAKKVAKEFKELYPEIIQQSKFTSYDNIIFINMCASNGIFSANISKSRAQGYSSGGGGFSSGGGGSGSFGGGGGGGGFR